MQRVLDLDHYRTLVKDNKARLGKVCSNCKVMSSAFAAPAAAGRLSFARHDNGLLVRVDEGGYATLYYYWRPGAPLPDLPDNAPLYVEETGACDEQHQTWLAQAGLHIDKRNGQYVLERPADACADHATDAGLVGCEFVRCVDEVLALKVVALWERRLKVADIPLEHREFLATGDVVYCALDEDGELAGAIWWQDAGKTRLMRHIVVDEHHERRGIARALLSLCATDAWQTGKLRVSTWISDTNAASIALHERMGFRATSRVVWQFSLD